MLYMMEMCSWFVISCMLMCASFLASIEGRPGSYSLHRGTDAGARRVKRQSGTAPLKLGAFNGKTFGVAKMSDANKKNVFAQIVDRYDIMLLQEIRDASGYSVDDLLDEVNYVVSSSTFAYVISARLGRSETYKEQYAFFYRTERVSVTDTYQYPDAGEVDLFEREPYAVRFSTQNTAISDFALVASHIKPTEACEEINLLDDVYDAVVTEFGIDDVMIMGDLNADCSYVTATEYPTLDLVADPGHSPNRFTWEIDSTVDTTVSTTDCAYDRLVSAGSSLKDSLVSGSAAVFTYTDITMGTLTDADISDHYPVEIEIAGEEDDECALKTDNCHDEATCDNSVGSFTCTCNAGYQGDGVTCTDEDECSLETHNCAVEATCTNTAGSYSCACNAGFEGDGVTCTNIDECTVGTHNCDADATCTNTVGSFTCACNTGYTGNGETCADIDECTGGTHNCDADATCTNTVGSFTCACNTGYTGNGETCAVGPLDSITVATAFSIENSLSSDSQLAQVCAAANPVDRAGFDCRAVPTTSPLLYMLTQTGVSNAVTSLQDLEALFSDLMSPVVISLSDAYFDEAAILSGTPAIADHTPVTSQTYDIKIIYDLASGAQKYDVIIKKRIL